MNVGKRKLKTIFGLSAVLIALLAGGCSPEFNRKAPPPGPPAPPAPAPIVPRDPDQVIDHNVTGGGRYGVSTSYKLSGVNISAGVNRGVGAGSSKRLKGGTDGQLPGSTFVPQ